MLANDVTPPKTFIHPHNIPRPYRSLSPLDNFNDMLSANIDETLKQMKEIISDDIGSSMLQNNMVQKGWNPYQHIHGAHQPLPNNFQNLVRSPLMQFQDFLHPDLNRYINSWPFINYPYGHQRPSYQDNGFNIVEPKPSVVPQPAIAGVNHLQTGFDKLAKPKQTIKPTTIIKDTTKVNNKEDDDYDIDIRAESDMEKS